MGEFFFLFGCYSLLSVMPGIVVSTLAQLHSATHNSGQEIQVDLVLIVQQNITSIGLFLVFFQPFHLLLLLGIRAGNT